MINNQIHPSDRNKQIYLSKLLIEISFPKTLRDRGLSDKPRCLLHLPIKTKAILIAASYPCTFIDGLVHSFSHIIRLRHLLYSLLYAYTSSWTILTEISIIVHAAIIKLPHAFQLFLGLQLNHGFPLLKLLEHLKFLFQKVYPHLHCQDIYKGHVIVWASKEATRDGPRTSEWTKTNLFALGNLPLFWELTFFCFSKIHSLHISRWTIFITGSFPLLANMFIPFSLLWPNRRCHNSEFDDDWYFQSDFLPP